MHTRVRVQVRTLCQAWRVRECASMLGPMEDFGRCLALLIALGLSACANPTQRGKALYVDGRLIEAAEVFEHGEPNLEHMGSSDCVRYGLYRGATLLKLGDLDGAAQWLYFAQQAESHHPGSLESSDRQLLRLAFKDLDRRRALVKPAVDPLTGAVARASAGLSAPLVPDVVAPVDSSSPKREPTPRAETSHLPANRP